MKKLRAAIYPIGGEPPFSMVECEEGSPELSVTVTWEGEAVTVPIECILTREEFMSMRTYHAIPPSDSMIAFYRESLLYAAIAAFYGLLKKCKPEASEVID